MKRNDRQFLSHNGFPPGPVTGIRSVPPYTLEINTDDPGIIEQVFRDAGSLNASGEMEADVTGRESFQRQHVGSARVRAATRERKSTGKKQRVVKPAAKPAAKPVYRM